MTSTSTRTKPLIALAFLAASAALWWPLEAQAVRLKEIAAVQGVRTCCHWWNVSLVSPAALAAS